MSEKKPLPTIEEIVADDGTFNKNDKFNYLLNQEVPPKWIKNHPIAKMKDDKGSEVPLKYISIDKIEYLLTKIFQNWSVEVVRCGEMFQSIYCHVRLKVIHPVTGNLLTQDGVGAVAVQTEKGASASDLSKVRSNAIQIGLPAAESYAIKDAAEKFGRIFGKDLSRRNTLAFTPGSGSYDKKDIAPAAAAKEITDTIADNYSLSEDLPL